MDPAGNMASTLKCSPIRFIDKLLSGSINFDTIGYQICRQFTLSSSITATRRATWQANIPVPPKRPTTSFFMFINERGPAVRAQMKRDNPGVKSTDVAKHLGQLWKTLPEDQKQGYVKHSEERFAEYAKEMAAYRKILTQDEKLAIKQRREDRIREKETRKFKQKLKASNKPRKPISGFLLYSQQLSGRRPENMGMQEWAKQLSQGWNELPTGEKMDYNQEANAQREVYEKELSKWIQTMLVTGNKDLVSKSELKKELDKLGKPRSARNAMKLFISEQSGGGLIENVKKYSALPDSIKKQYTEKAARDKIRASSERDQWIGIMNNKGLGNFVELAEQQLVPVRRVRPKKAVAKKKKAPKKGKRKTAKKARARKLTKSEE